MGKLTTSHMYNMTFDEKVNYLLGTVLVDDLPLNLCDFVRSVILEYIERIDESNEIADSFRKEIRELKEILEDNIDDNAELQEKNIKLKLRVKGLEGKIPSSSTPNSIFDCLIIRDIKKFILESDLNQLSTDDLRILYDLKQSVKRDIRVLSDSLEALESVNDSANFINKYF